MAKKIKIPGEVLFKNFYQDIYQDRWPGLLQALSQESVPAPLPGGLLKEYFMDHASIICAGALEVQAGQKVLDLCAAPGGKTLVLALALRGSGSLTSNDRSSSRRARLHRVIEEHLPEEYTVNIKVTGHDASLWGQKEKNAYDRILLDAPCSSERHVLHSPEHLNDWTASRTKHLALQSFAMLASALDALKPGGIMVYSTCSLSPLENEDNVEKLSRKRPGQWEEVSRDGDLGEKKKWGRILLPDTAQGYGPIYYCRIKKI